MIELKHNDGTWQNLISEWSKQCSDYEQDFESYMSVTLPFLSEQITKLAGNLRSGVFASISKEKEHTAICWCNSTLMPGFDGMVLRVRHLVLSPRYDFEDYEERVYGEALTQVFSGIYEMSCKKFDSPHIKIHFRSPADVAIFGQFASNLHDFGRFSDVSMVGSWLTVTK